MAIRLQNINKTFMEGGRSRRPLYRQMMMMRAQGQQERTKVVLDKIDLQVKDGSRVAVIGRNGAGKSTLLRLIAGIYQPTSGEIQVDGPVCCFLEPGAGAAPSLPVRDNVFLYASLAGLGYQDTKNSLDRVLEFSSLQDQAYTWVEHLSFGMQQRLFMAIQLEVMRLQRARVFLFDEFLMGVDKTFRSRVEDALTHFPSADQIVLHASHDHELMLRTCPDGIFIDECGIRAQGTTAEVLGIYRNG